MISYRDCAILEILYDDFFCYNCTWKLNLCINVKIYKCGGKSLYIFSSFLTRLNKLRRHKNLEMLLDVYFLIIFSSAKHLLVNRFHYKCDIIFIVHIERGVWFETLFITYFYYSKRYNFSHRLKH